MFHVSTICKKTLDDSHMLNQACNFIFRKKDGNKITPGLTPYDFSVTPHFSYPGLILASIRDI